MCECGKGSGGGRRDKEGREKRSSRLTFSKHSTGAIQCRKHRALRPTVHLRTPMSEGMTTAPPLQNTCWCILGTGELTLSTDCVEKVRLCPGTQPALPSGRSRRNAWTQMDRHSPSPSRQLMEWEITFPQLPNPFPCSKGPGQVSDPGLWSHGANQNQETCHHLSVTAEDITPLARTPSAKEGLLFIFVTINKSIFKNLQQNVYH